MKTCILLIKVVTLNKDLSTTLESLTGLTKISPTMKPSGGFSFYRKFILISYSFFFYFYETPWGVL